MINRKDLEKSSCLPVGEYQLEVINAAHKTGIGKVSGKPYECFNLETEVVTPESEQGRKFFMTVFPDKALAKLITVGLGKSLDEIFGKNDSLAPEKVVELLRGQFLRCRLGIKERNGEDRNEVAEMLPPEKASVKEDI